MKKTNTPPHTGGSGLWSRDFTIITLGSVVSMVGGTLSGFALSIMVLDYTGSTLLYILTNVGYQLPMLICPLIAGPYLDRMSRKKAIYRLDFLSAGIALVMFLLLRSGWYSYPVLLGYTVLSGAIESVYSVAYDSLYPNLIPEGHLSQGYSVSSLLWPPA
ncbi:MAG: MFS transporter, partial [Clostridiales bacterium]|nr:MFS transporter [Clostridiales bacterium]